MVLRSEISFYGDADVNRRFYGRKFRFMAMLTLRHKTKFPTVKPPIYRIAVKRNFRP